MKKTLVAIAALVVSLNTFGQGQVHFANRDLAATPPISEVITRQDGSTDFTGFIAELLLVNADTTLTSVGTTTFNPNRPGSWIAIDPVIPGVTSGTANFVVQVYNGTGYNSATTTFHGTSAPVNGQAVTTSPAAPAEFQAFQGHAFQVVPVVPEPTTLALGAIGLGALLLRRRK